MAEFGTVSRTVTKTYAGVTTTVVGSFYYNIAISNTDTTASVTVTPTSKLVVTGSGTPNSSAGGHGSGIAVHGGGISGTSSDHVPGSGTGNHESVGGYRVYNNTTGANMNDSQNIYSPTNRSVRSTGTFTYSESYPVSFSVTKSKSTQYFSIQARSIPSLHMYVYARAGSTGVSFTDDSQLSFPIAPSGTFSVSPITSYTVKYNGNGHTGGTVPGNQTKWYNEALPLATGVPTRTGYTFKGWATSSTGTVAYTPGASYKNNAAVTLYAVWEIIKYNITYNGNGHTGGTVPATHQKTYGQNATISTSKPTKTGYTFLGWATSTARAGTGAVDYASGSSYGTNSALNLYAVWELTYKKPTLTNLRAMRCESDGLDADEGKYGRVIFDWTVFYSTAAKYYGGTTPGPYANNTVSSCTVQIGNFTNSSISLSGHSGTAGNDPKIIAGNGSYDEDTIYPITVTLIDSQSEYTTDNKNKIVLKGQLPAAFFPLDFNPTASAVGFFMPAPDNGQGAYFAKDVHVDNSCNLYLTIDDNAASGVDYNIKIALTNLGWTDILTNY